MIRSICISLLLALLAFVIFICFVTLGQGRLEAEALRSDNRNLITDNLGLATQVAQLRADLAISQANNEVNIEIAKGLTQSNRDSSAMVTLVILLVFVSGAMLFMVRYASTHPSQSQTQPQTVPQFVQEDTKEFLTDGQVTERWTRKTTSQQAFPPRQTQAIRQY